MKTYLWQDANQRFGTIRTDQETEEPPPEFAAWTAAVEDYLRADERGEATEEHRQRVRETWMGLRENPAFEPTPYAQQLIEQIWHTTH